MHPPTYHLASLDPIEVYFNPKRLPPKADTDIFSISLILPFFVTFHPKAHLEIFNSSEQIFFVVNLFCLSAFIYLFRISVCSNLVGRQIQSWTQFVRIVQFCFVGFYQSSNTRLQAHTAVLEIQFSSCLLARIFSFLSFTMSVISI